MSNPIDYVPPSSINNFNEDGESLRNTFLGDYYSNQKLDVYENSTSDKEDLNQLTFKERRLAEKEMHERDIIISRKLKNSGIFSYVDMKERFNNKYFQPFKKLETENVNLENFNIPLTEWLNKDKVQREVKRKFYKFLTVLRNGQGVQIYIRRLQKMCIANERSLKVSYLHLSSSLPSLAIWTADCPRIMIDLFNQVATICASQFYPGYEMIQKGIHVRIEELPVSDKLRDLRHSHLNMLIKVSGVITRRTRMFPKLERIKYDCAKCGYTIGPYIQRGKEKIRPKKCYQCGLKGPFQLNIAKTMYRNYQSLILQETPNSVPAGRIPRSREVVCIDDLVDIVKPGEEVEVTGIYTNQFDTFINLT